MKNKTKIKPIPGETPLPELADRIAKLAVRNLNANVLREDKMTLEEHRKEQAKKDAQAEKLFRKSEWGKNYPKS